jgi:hypothetical protein
LLNIYVIKLHFIRLLAMEERVALLV